MKRPQQPKEILQAERRQCSVHNPAPQQTSGTHRRARATCWDHPFRFGAYGVGLLEEMRSDCNGRKSGCLFRVELLSEGPAGPRTVRSALWVLAEEQPWQRGARWNLI